MIATNGNISNILMLSYILAMASSIILLPSSYQQPSGANMSNPYWRRPGCYRVGHTRTISIPGCVKFNLSTNACRGYCTSYSIPSTEDLGSQVQAEQEREEAIFLDEGLLAQAPKKQRPTLFIEEQIPLHQQNEKNNNDFRPADVKQSAPVLVVVPDESTVGGSSTERVVVPLKIKNQQQSDYVGVTSDQQQSINVHHLSGQLGKSPQSGDQSGGLLSVGVSGPMSSASGGAEVTKPDVVSVSQCCNMMETEDVHVNLRCGANEIRRLVFKSAKSCECFFCKHV